ncbi:MAG: hypothetical protein R3C52_15700 [Hyphomonadaceae bacterium]
MMHHYARELSHHMEQATTETKRVRAVSIDELRRKLGRYPGETLEAAREEPEISQRPRIVWRRAAMAD